MKRVELVGSSGTDVPAQLEVRGVGKQYGGVHALSDLTLTFQIGEIRGLLGPNGAGKTTLFDILAGAQRPSCGSVLLDGIDITNRSPTWRARSGIRRTFQRQQVFGWLSVEDNVLAAQEWAGGGGGVAADLLALPGRRRVERERRAEVDEILSRLGLADQRQQLASHLPIGGTRLLELARALVGAPRVLLLDEPTSGLEPHETAKLGEVLHELRAQGECTIVLVEHDVSFVMAHVDQVTVLDRGYLVAEGAPSTIQNDSSVRSLYLGT